ncbi:PREDICTED: splicing factor 3B subunit 4-like [Rhagoletis zephyria]|uniref:splicing factor 3B subunit 4-like n=1 Tax=Rhagoletis zephyria TaxID=28612 RepID=UPI0008115B3B|nr:PREDICTED: splicing factor 3B subunit 4-like [Rhagoletis zephyria]
MQAEVLQTQQQLFLTPLPITVQQKIPVQLWRINQKVFKSDANKQQQQQQQQHKQQQEQTQHFATIRRVPSPHYYSGRCQ